MRLGMDGFTPRFMMYYFITFFKGPAVPGRDLSVMLIFNALVKKKLCTCRVITNMGLYGLQSLQLNFFVCL